MERKQSILEAAKKSFSMFGYKGTTVDQIAKIANVGKGTIYTYFENKEVILHEIISNLIHEMRTVADQAVQPNQTFFENLHKALYGVLVFRKEHELMIKLSQEVREFGTQVAQDALLNIEHEVIDYIKSQLQNAMRIGKIRNCDPDITAFIMVKLYVSLIFEWEQKHGTLLTNEQVFEIFKLHLIEGLMK